MPNRNAEALALDHAHCRAICDEIGERLRQVLKPEALEIPQRLLMLLNRLAKLEQAPSIVPSIDDEISFPQCSGPSARITRSIDPALSATNRKLASVGS
jgi:hypothetical protein